MPRAKIDEVAPLAQAGFMIELSEQQVIDQLAQRLVGVYTAVEADQISRLVDEEYSRFDGRPIRDFIPLFVERSVSDRLSKLIGA